MRRGLASAHAKVTRRSAARPAVSARSGSRPRRARVQQRGAGPVRKARGRAVTQQQQRPVREQKDRLPRAAQDEPGGMYARAAHRASSSRDRGLDRFLAAGPYRRAAVEPIGLLGAPFGVLLELLFELWERIGGAARIGPPRDGSAARSVPLPMLGSRCSARPARCLPLPRGRSRRTERSERVDPAGSGIPRKARGMSMGRAARGAARPARPASRRGIPLA